MSEIRNLTRNGETFYPLTCIDAIVNRDGSYAIDDKPTAESKNLITSDGVALSFQPVTGYDFSTDVSRAYYGTNGTEFHNGYRQKTVPIAVNEGDVVLFKTAGESTDLVLAALNNGVLVSASSIAGSSGVLTDYNYTVPSGITHVIICGLNEVTPSAYLSTSIIGRIIELEDKNKLIGYYDFSTSADRDYYVTNGNKLNNVYRQKTIPIKVSVDDVIYISCCTYSDTYMIAALNNGVLVQDASVAGIYSSGEQILESYKYVVPSGVTHVIICSNNEVNPAVGIIGTVCGEIQEEAKRAKDTEKEIDAKTVSDNMPTYNSSALVKSGGVFDMLYKQGIFKNAFDISDLQLGWYINNSTGAIIQSGIVNHRLVKFSIPVGKYWIKNNGSPGSNVGILWKYTDNTYATAEEKIINTTTNQVNEIFDLEAGYYAFGWISDSEDVVIGESLFVRVDDFNKVINEYSLPIRNFERGIQDFSQFTFDGGYFRKESNTKMVSIGIGRSQGAYFPTETYEDDFILSMKLTPLTADNSGNYEAVIAKTFKVGQPKGTYFKFGKNNNGKYIHVHSVYNGTEYEGVRVAMSNDITFDIDHPIVVRIEKYVTTTTLFKIIINDEFGVEQVADNIAAWSGTTPADASSLAGTAPGRLSIFANAGTFAFEDIFFGYHKNLNNIKLIVAGHSYVEGQNSTLFQMNKRFCDLLITDIGKDNCCIWGVGGGGIGMNEGLLMQAEWMNTARYMLMYQGDNDPDTLETAEAYDYLDKSLKKMGIKPIWCTVSPRRNQGSTPPFPVLNEYFLTHFDCIDVRPMFYNPDGTINQSIFVDNSHLTLDGYEMLYKYIKARAPYFWAI